MLAVLPAVLLALTAPIYAQSSWSFEGFVGTNTCLRRSVLVYTSDSATYVKTITDIGSTSFPAEPTMCSNVSTSISTLISTQTVLATTAINPSTITVYVAPSASASSSSTIANYGFEDGNVIPLDVSGTAGVTAEVATGGPLQPWSGDNYLLITFDGTGIDQQPRRRQVATSQVYNVTRLFDARAGSTYTLSAYAAAAPNGDLEPVCTLTICSGSTCGSPSTLTSAYLQYSYIWAADATYTNILATFSLSCAQQAYVALDDVSVVSDNSAPGMQTATVTQYITRTYTLRQTDTSVALSISQQPVPYTTTTTQLVTTTISGSVSVLTSTFSTVLWSTVTAYEGRGETKTVSLVETVPSTVLTGYAFSTAVYQQGTRTLNVTRTVPTTVETVSSVTVTAIEAVENTKTINQTITAVYNTTSTIFSTTTVTTYRNASTSTFLTTQYATLTETLAAQTLNRTLTLNQTRTLPHQTFTWNQTFVVNQTRTETYTPAPLTETYTPAALTETVTLPAQTITTTQTVVTSIANTVRQTVSYAADVPQVALASPTAIFGDVNGSPEYVDDEARPVNVPWALSLYGQRSTQVYVGSNGVVMWNTGTSFCCRSSRAIPYPEWDTAAMGLFDDLLISAGTPQGVYYQIDGVAPRRTITFEFYHSNYRNHAQYYHFLTTFAEAFPNTVTYEYLNVSDQGATAAVGVQSNTGGRYLQYSNNQAIIYPGLKLTFYANAGSAGSYYVSSPGTPNAVRVPDPSDEDIRRARAKKMPTM